MHFPASCAAPSAETFIAELLGITEESVPQCGDAAPELILALASAMHQLLAKPELQDAAVKAINKALSGREDMMKGLQENIEKILSEGSDTAVQEIDSRLLELQKELLKKANTRQNYDALADEIEALREQKHTVMVGSAEREGIKKRVAEMQQFLAEQKTEITEYDESLVRQLIEKITVYEDQFEVMFKSHTTVEIKRIF